MGSRRRGPAALGVLLAGLMGCAERTGMAPPDDGDAGTADVASDDVRPAVDAAHDATTTPAGETCATALPLPADATPTSGRTPTRGVPSLACSASDAPQRFYTFVLPAHTRAVVTATPTGAPWRLHLRALTACDARECLTEAQSSAPGAPATVTIDSPGDVPLTKFVTVSGESASSGGAFDITLRLEPLTPSPSCAARVERDIVFPSDSLRGALAGEPRVPALACASSPGPEHIYRLHVSERTGVVLFANCPAAVCSLAIRRACDDTRGEIACERRPGFAGSDIRTTLDPGDYFVLVASDRSTPAEYTVTFSAVTFPPSASCETAPIVGDGTTIRENLALAGPLDLRCGVDPETNDIGNPLYYRATLEPGHTLVVTSPVSADLGVIVPPGCAGGTCVHPLNHLDPVFRNRQPTPLDALFLLGIGGDDPSMPRFVDVAFRILPPAPNSSCATATPLADGARLTDLRPVTGGPSTSCGMSTTNTLYYSVDVPAHYILDVRATQGRDYFFDQTHLRIVDGCGAGTCLAVSPTGTNELRASASNPTNSTRTMIVELSDPPGGNRVDLSVDLVPPPANAQCSAAMPLADQVHLVEQNLVPGFDATSACSSGGPAPLLYYSAAIPPGQTLTALASPSFRSPGVTPQLGVLPACDALTCLAASTAMPDFGWQLLSFANAGASTQNVVLVARDPAAGTGYFDLTVQIASSTPSARAVEVRSGFTQTCARRDDGTVWCAGFATGTSSPIWRVPRPISGVSDAAELAVGDSAACARRVDGTAVCWGSNVSGELGDGTTVSRATAAPVVGLTAAVHLAVGRSRACASRTDGSVVCWGGCDDLGRCGLPLAVVPSLAGVVEIAAGMTRDFACARSTDGLVRCWGENDRGQLGDGTTTGRAIPAPIAGLAGVRQLALGAVHGCAVLTDGTVRCWGSGYLGDGGFRDVATPVPVAGLTNAVQVALGWEHTCALIDDGSVRCWGDNRQRQLGDGSTEMARPTPVPVIGLSGVVQITARANSTCAVRSDRTVHCWGANDFGTLGDGTLTSRPTPTTTLF